jgi:hypothetical protein
MDRCVACRYSPPATQPIPDTQTSYRAVLSRQFSVNLFPLTPKLQMIMYKTHFLPHRKDSASVLQRLRPTKRLMAQCAGDCWR